MNTTKSAHNSTVHALPSAGAPGIPMKRPPQKKLKATRGKVQLTALGQRHHQYCLAKHIVKKKNQREHEKLSVGCRAQNWPALLGSHCRRRTMDGSLLAPRMNSSRESFPGKQEAG